jgi:hypothetical protein
MNGLELVLAFLAGAVNVNEWVHKSIECSGAGPEPLTDAQFEAVAQLVAAAHKATGLPINGGPRSTIAASR